MKMISDPFSCVRDDEDWLLVNKTDWHIVSSHYNKRRAENNKELIESFAKARGLSIEYIVMEKNQLKVVK